MVDLDKWLRLYESSNPTIRTRAAQALVLCARDVPLPVLLNILDSGLGVSHKEILLKRDEPELLKEMVKRLSSREPSIRELACNVLGKLGDYAATEHLLKRLDDQHMMVRRAAGFALAFLNDTNAIPELKRQYEQRRADDINVRFALETALESLGAEFTKHPW